jgi:hypothetical protein
MGKKINLRRGHKVSLALLIGFAVVAFWRGVWGLLDLYLFPNNLKLSLWVSALLGVIILISLHKLVKQLM